MKTRLTEILGTKLPLILGPMRQITLGEMAAAVSNAGAFGQVAASGLSGERLREEIEKAKKLTKHPFGLNIPIHRDNAVEALEIAIESEIHTITTSGGNPSKITEQAKQAGLHGCHERVHTGHA